MNGVDAFFDRVYASNADARAFANIKIAAIGPATAERIRAKGLTPDFVPQKATSVSVFQELSEREEWMGKRLLLPRADIAPGELPENLRQAGAVVDEVDAYHTEAGDFDAETLKLEMEQGAIDAVTFTSSSTVRHFVERLDPDFVSVQSQKFAAVSIGPETSKTMLQYNMTIAAEAEVHTIPGVVQALIRLFSDRASLVSGTDKGKASG